MLIILATSNANKRAEIHNIFSHYHLSDIEIASFNDFLEPFEIVENGNTFAQNAKIKAQAIYNALCNIHKINKNFLVLSEDSGICIEALNGAPSVYSARFKDISLNAILNENLNSNDQRQDGWVAYQKTLPHSLGTDSINVERVIYELQIRGLKYSNASFVANVCLFGTFGNQKTLCKHFEGICKGRAITHKHGEKGFGYDPIFIPDGYTQTLAQIDNKDSLSHRKKALEQCVEFLRSEIL